MAAKPVTEAPVTCTCGHYWVNHQLGTGCLLGWDATHKGCSCEEYTLKAVGVAR